MTNEGWAAWLEEKLADRGNVYLVRRSGVKDNGRPVIDDSRVSKWKKGAQRPSVEMVIRTARALEADESEALMAAGYVNAEPAFTQAAAEKVATRAALNLDALRSTSEGADVQIADLVDRLFEALDACEIALALGVDPRLVRQFLDDALDVWLTSGAQTLMAHATPEASKRFTDRHGELTDLARHQESGDIRLPSVLRDVTKDAQREGRRLALESVAGALLAAEMSPLAVLDALLHSGFTLPEISASEEARISQGAIAALESFLRGGGDGYATDGGRATSPTVARGHADQRDLTEIEQLDQDQRLGESPEDGSSADDAEAG